MTQYSHSRLSTFEQCNLKFKFKYVDKVEAEEGIKVLYCKVYKEKTINTEIFNTLLNLDEIRFT